MKVVVSQPMFIPWAGLFEQIKNCDVYVHYNDVQMPQGRSFMHRVQIRSQIGQRWLSTEINRSVSGKSINQVLYDSSSGWRKQHLNLLKLTYKGMPYFNDMLELAEVIYSFQSDQLDLFNQNAIELIAKWLGFNIIFKTSEELNIKGSSTQRLVDICEYFEASEYITGLGALNYLQHDLFSKRNIEVSYMKYNIQAYRQPFSGFIPYVSILDAIACNGINTNSIMKSELINWRLMVNEPN